jgi:tetratricopeptide (TPR) repeat protein
MAALQQRIDAALAHHQAGRLSEALPLYDSLILACPDLADLRYLRGMALWQSGDGTRALDDVSAALAVKPGQAEWLFNFGVILRQAGRLSEAVQAFHDAAACALSPLQQAEALGEAGASLGAQGRYDAAEADLRAALRLVPGYARVKGNLAAIIGNRYNAKNALAAPDAVAHLREALDLAPDHPDLLERLALALLRAERANEALQPLQSLLRQQPNHRNGRIALGEAFSVLGRLDEAIAIADQLLHDDPQSVGALLVKADALHGQGDLAGAIVLLRKALALDAASFPALVNLGTVLRDAGDDRDAECCYRQALALEPDAAPAHWQRAQARLLAGDFPQGWIAYEHRWRMPGFAVPPHIQSLPLWHGERLKGRLLVHAEQGHGDTLQFIRYVSLLWAKGLKLAVQVQPALLRLMHESLAEDIILQALDSPPPDDCQARCPLLSLPLILGTELADIPSFTPYLSVPFVRKQFWEERIGRLAGLKVGLVWAGDGRSNDPRAAAIDRRRSLDLEQLALLGSFPGLSLISLQKGPKAAQARSASPPLHLADWTDELHDFADTAALIAHLDLVIGVDTAVIHLSGALARPTVVLSRFDGCWRWLRQRDDTPWYKNMVIFRQERWNDWREPIRRLVGHVEDWMAQKSR